MTLPRRNPTLTEIERITDDKSSYFDMDVVLAAIQAGLESAPIGVESPRSAIWGMLKGAVWPIVLIGPDKQP
jgi:hypothetical protein